MPPIASPPAAMSALSIEIGGPSSTPFKSIDELDWNNIPGLAILTGVNGSGKSQLLELLAYKLTNTHYLHHGDLLAKTRVTVTGGPFEPDCVAYMPSADQIDHAPAIGLAQLSQIKAQLYQNLRNNAPNNLVLRARRARVEKSLGINDLTRLSQEEFVKRLPDDFLFMLEESEVVGGLCHVFMAYRVQMHEELEKGTNLLQLPMVIGPPPWDVVNEALRVAEFAYSVESPLKTKILANYQLRLVDTTTGTAVAANDLSSGEKAILKLILWMYNTQHGGRFPRLFLLDEPDAHLHPSMTRQFLNVIKEVLVDKYNIRVILSTHSPSTVALAPEGSVFEMSRTRPRITASKSVAHTVGLLTAGLVTVSRGTRFVFVEDEDDVDFYNAVRDVLSDTGPSWDPMGIFPAPSIVFLASSIRHGATSQSGGKSVVASWLDKFDQPPLNDLFRGIIDRDAGNPAGARLSVLARYSIENYLLDPINVFAALILKGKAPPVAGLSITPGDEHRLRSCNQQQLQSVVDAIVQIVEPTIAGLKTTDRLPRVVAFTNGTTLTYRVWLLERQGHSLFQIYQAAFTSAVMGRPALLQMWRRVRMVPIELATILRQLQNSG
jgi:predicted ATPase